MLRPAPAEYAGDKAPVEEIWPRRRRSSLVAPRPAWNPANETHNDRPRHAQSNDSCVSPGGDRGGRGGAIEVGSPRWPRIRRTTSGSSIAATKRSRPPQRAQCRTSISNTRRSRSAHRTQRLLRGIAAPTPSSIGGDRPASGRDGHPSDGPGAEPFPAGSSAISRARATAARRRAAWGANTPWYSSRLTRGFGVKAARRPRKSSGSNSARGCRRAIAGAARAARDRPGRS